MKIVEADWSVVEIPMRISVEHALAERKVARNVIVRLKSDQGLQGFGEACPREYVTGESLESAGRVLDGDLLPGVRECAFSDFPEVVEFLRARGSTISKLQLSAFAGLDLALLDLAGKTFGISAGEAVGPVAEPKVCYSGVVASNSPAKARKYAWLMRLFGAKIVKVKVAGDLETNMAILQEVRSVLGPGVRLRIDANAAWSGDEAIRQLEAMRPFQLEGVEQPCAGDHFEGMQQVTAARIVPVAADESLCTRADAERLVAGRGCDIFNLRVSKNGGLVLTHDLYQIAMRGGLRCQLGAQVGETGLLSAAGRHIATRCPGLVWFEGSYGNLLLKKELTRPNIRIRRGGWARALTTPGLGVEPHPKRLGAWSAQSA